MPELHVYYGPEKCEYTNLCEEAAEFTLRVFTPAKTLWRKLCSEHAAWTMQTTELRGN